MSGESQTQLAATRARRLQGLAHREQIGDGSFALLFVVAAALLAVLGPSHGEADLAVAAAFVVAFALASSVEFHVGAGYAMPTQLVFVPMLVALPPALVPLLIALACALGKLPSSIRGRRGRDRWLLGVADSWFSLAPAAVIAYGAGGELTVSDWPWFAAAFAAQFAGDALVSTTRAWVCVGAPPLDVAREVLWVYRIDVLLTPIGILAAVAAAQEPFAGLLVLPLIGLFVLFAREREDRIDKQLELERAYRGTAMLLGDVIEDDDAYTGEHTRGVVGLALAVARELGVDEDGLRDCEFGALLHDVGKVRIPKEIINKPGPLDDEEWAIMRTHTILGQRMLASVGGVLARVGEVVRASHERWDGRGYPDGLITDQIPLPARIVSACDAYNAMTTDRSYRKALPADVAMAEMESCAGMQFDPQVVTALLRVLSAERAAQRVESDASLLSLRALRSSP